MIRIYDDLAQARRELLKRTPFDEWEPGPEVRQGIERIFGAPLTPDEVVARILRDVRARGDDAVRDYTRRIDGVDLADLRVSAAEMEAALAQVDRGLLEALDTAAEQVRRFHEKQSRQSWMDWSERGALGQIVRPIERVGVYAPGGRATYPSSVIMAVVPARVAGVREVYVATPPQRDGGCVPVLLAAAHVAGADAVFKLGGAHAIGALAYGTQSVPRVDKIVGPGNLFVVLAKKHVFGTVDIDQLPGPTETVVIADAEADPDFAAADLLAQAEHDPLAQAIFITDSRAFAERVAQQVEEQLGSFARRDVALSALRRSGMVVVRDLRQGVQLANEYAPEHLCLLVRDPWSLVNEVQNAGGIFVGEQSLESIGDYVAGPTHIMPTGGTARFSSPLSIDDFVKVSSVIALNERGVRELGPAAVAIAEAEGLKGHADAIRLRLRKARRAQ